MAEILNGNIQIFKEKYGDNSTIGETSCAYHYFIRKFLTGVCLWKKDFLEPEGIAC